MLNAAVQSLTVKYFFLSVKRQVYTYSKLEYVYAVYSMLEEKKNIDLLYLIVIEKGNEWSP